MYTPVEREERYHLMQHYPDPVLLPDPQMTIQQLIDTIAYHNHAYYTNNNPLIADWEYDRLFAYLVQCERTFPHLVHPNSPTQKLLDHYTKNDGFVTKRHPIPLRSLDNTYNANDLKAFFVRTDKLISKHLAEKKIPTHALSDTQTPTKLDIRYSIEPKCDGLAVSIVYRNGILDAVITRGNGEEGDDITNNAKTITRLPHTLTKPLSGVFRGEIVMPKHRFEQLNNERLSRGEPPFANARNACAGSIKLLDSAEVAKRNLDCVVYDILDDGGSGLIDQCQSSDDVFAHCAGLGLPIITQRTCGTLSPHECIARCLDPKTKKIIDGLPFDCDGLVIKIASMYFRQNLGNTSHHPKRAIAYKFPATQASSRIREVTWSMGRTGVLTPVATIEPLELSGVTIKQASLHNREQIKSKDIRLGDAVWVQRSGEVIPYILGPIPERRNGTEQSIVPPSHCTFCGILVRIDGPFVRCPNDECTGTLPYRIRHAVSKDCLDCQGRGEHIIDVVIKQGRCQRQWDFFRINEYAHLLRRIQGFGDKKVDQLVAASHATKTSQPLWRRLHAMGIPGLGKTMAQTVAHAMHTEGITTRHDVFTRLDNTDKIHNLYGLGDVAMKEIPQRAHKHHHWIDELTLLGCHWAYTTPPQTKTNRGSICITGTFPLPRSQLASWLSGRGFVIDETLKKTTTYLLCGDNPGSKITQAHTQGTIILDSTTVHTVIPDRGERTSDTEPTNDGGLFG
ncbi:MAG: NAD-dependent DNA ligase LigA [Candidatus Absconditabacterales bacterium]|nr:NAD-dependent DNA ligase LigA [Candidatus Absconditabacterales bacterium]